MGTSSIPTIFFLLPAIISIYIAQQITGIKSLPTSMYHPSLLLLQFPCILWTCIFPMCPKLRAYSYGLSNIELHIFVCSRTWTLAFLTHQEKKLWKCSCGTIVPIEMSCAMISEKQKPTEGSQNKWEAAIFSKNEKSST